MAAVPSTTAVTSQQQSSEQQQSQQQQSQQQSPETFQIYDYRSTIQPDDVHNPNLWSDSINTLTADKTIFPIHLFKDSLHALGRFGP